MNKIKKIVLATALIGLVVMGGFAYKVYGTFFTPNTNFKGQYEVYIPTGSDYNQAFMLVAAAVEDRDAFHTTAVQKGYHKNPKPGRYILQEGMSNNDIINTIRSANTPIKVTFNNQERLEDLAGRIAQQIEADSTAIIAAMTNPSFLKENGFTRDNALSMYLPNSYDFYWNTSPEKFRAKMLSYYQSYWNEQRLNKAKELGLSPQEVIALASIVQKETAKVDERPRVAGVYMNRIKRGMKLDADPTVIYAKKKLDDNFNQVIKRVLFKDLILDSPYNTYKYTGVPPGPIVTPDLNAIEAVLNYEKHGYFYFVADVTNFGYHKFARNLAQHNSNALAYRRWVQNQGIRR
jgi:UPF0755 protein